VDVRLVDVLRTGRLGCLYVGLAREEVTELVGPPDTVGGMSQRHLKPSIYRYGDLEVYFGSGGTAPCCGLYLEFPLETSIRLPPKLKVLEWQLTAGAPQSRVAGYLNTHGLAYSLQRSPGLGETLYLCRSAARLVFDEAGGLFSLYVGAIESPAH